MYFVQDKVCYILPQVSPNCFCRTNLPKEVMAFPDYPFPNQEESFLHHTEVLKYLESYCDHFDVRPCIKVDFLINLLICRLKFVPHQLLK